jgi:monothiol glutaredoxin
VVDGHHRFDAHGRGFYTDAPVNTGVNILVHPAFLISETTMDAKAFIQQTVTENPMVLFMKGSAQFPQCGFSGRAIQILKACGARNLVTVNVLEDEAVRQGIKEYANWPTIPQFYFKGQFVGGADILAEMHASGELQSLLGASTEE